MGDEFPPEISRTFPGNSRKQQGQPQTASQVTVGFPPRNRNETADCVRLYNRVAMDANAADEVIERAGRALIDAVPAPARAILFGSRADGGADEQSDFDFLVIERDVDDRFAEMVRLGRLLGRLLVPADAVV
jgi:predicted nucleotidyltransferase